MDIIIWNFGRNNIGKNIYANYFMCVGMIQNKKINNKK